MIISREALGSTSFVRSGGARAGLSLRRAGHRRVRGQDLEEDLHYVCLWYVFSITAVLSLVRSVLMRYLKAVFCVGSALQTWARSLTQLTGGRAIGGIGVGALRYGLLGFRRSKHSMVHPTRSTLSPLYMAEISPPEVRGSILALEQFSIVLGCVLGFWTGFLTRNSKSDSPCLGSRITNAAVVPGSLSWRIPLGLQLIPGILLGLGAFALPDSPRLLVLHGRREAALASLAKLRLRSLAEARTDPLIQVRTCSAYFDLSDIP
jgi:MFS family permease